MNHYQFDPQKLLKSLATRVDPLSDTEVTAIVEHHELNPTLNPKHVPPHPSKDFQVGTKRQSPATIAADSSTDTIVNQLNRENTAVEHFNPELQRAAFQFIKSDEKFGVDPEHKIKLYVAHAGFKHLRVPANQLRHLHLRDERDDERDDDGDDNGDEDDDGGQPPVELTAPHTANRFIVLTTPESYSTQVRMAFGNIKRLGGDNYTDGATEIYRIIKSLVRDGFMPPNFVAITASPILRRGLVDILAYVKAINMVSPGISSSPDYKRFTKSGALDKLGQAFVRFREKQRLGGDVDNDEIRK
ncbi:hypothetical protein ABEF95_009315 [Exophiala dermatitidis]